MIPTGVFTLWNHLAPTAASRIKLPDLVRRCYVDVEAAKDV